MRNVTDHNIEFTIIDKQRRGEFLVKMQYNSDSAAFSTNPNEHNQCKGIVATKVRSGHMSGIISDTQGSQIGLFVASSTIEHH